MAYKKQVLFNQESIIYLYKEKQRLYLPCDKTLSYQCSYNYF